MNGVPRLLVIDDEEINREIITEYLEDSGFDLTVAQGGQEALDLMAGDSAFDAVVLDRMMPDVNGLDVLRKMQSDPQLAAVPVIMQTAAAGHEQVAEGLLAGAYYYLTKPYHRDALVSVVRSALESVARRRELQRKIEDYSGVMDLMEEGLFRFRTLQHAKSTAAAVSTIAGNPTAVGLGLVELMINAVEHGNLGITFHDKSRLLAAEGWEKEIDARLAQPANAEKYVEIRILREAQSTVRVTITDQGEGFDWRRYLSFDQSRALHPNGRGIAMARHVAFSSLEFNERGNEVTVTFPASNR